MVERQERRWQDAYAAEAIDVMALKERMAECRARKEALHDRLAALSTARELRQRETEVLASLPKSNSTDRAEPVPGSDVPITV